MSKKDDHLEINIFSSSKKLYPIIKGNLSMILLVPTLIGGIWQLFSLLGLGFEYVRFFSITQLVADGLMMMIIIPLTAIFPILAYYIIRSFRKGALEKKNKSSFKRQLFYLIVSFSGLIILNYYYLDYTSSVFENKPSFFIELLAFLLFIPFIQNCFILGDKVTTRIEAYIRLSRRKVRTIFEKTWLNLLGLLNFSFSLSCFMGAMISALFTLVAFIGIVDSLGTYFISDNLSNVKNIHKVVDTQYGLSPNEYSIEYFNDSYIFIEHITVSEEEEKKLRDKKKDVPTEIIILKFDSLFEEK